MTIQTMTDVQRCQHRCMTSPQTMKWGRFDECVAACNTTDKHPGWTTFAVLVTLAFVVWVAFLWVTR